MTEGMWKQMCLSIENSYLTPLTKQFVKSQTWDGK